MSAELVRMLSQGKGNTKRAYLNFMAEEDSEEITDLFARKKWPSVLGSKEFGEWIKASFFDKKKHREVPDSIQLAPELDQIKQALCKAYGVDEAVLLTAQRGKINEPRNVAIYLGRMLRQDSLFVLGEAFGMTGYSPAAV